MDSQRLILFFVFSFAVFLLLDGWQRDQAARTPAAAEKGDKADKAIPGATIPTPTPGEKLATTQAAVPKEVAVPREQGKTIRVETDLVVAHLSTQGGDLRRLELKQHRDTVDKNKPFVLFDAAEHSYAAQAGLTGGKLPYHRTAFQAAADSYQLIEGQDVLEVRLGAPETDGVAVTKVYRFRRGSYLIDVGFEIMNKGSGPIQPYAYFQLVRDGKPPAGDSAMLPTFTGFAVYTEKEKFHKVTFEEVEKNKAAYPKNSDDGWIAIIQHYFLSAWLPKNGSREFYVRQLDGGLFAAGVIVPVGAVAPGATGTAMVPLYAGPEEPRKLEAIAPGLDLTVDYGWLTVIAVPLFWLLEWLHKWVGNWGVAIIILTVIIKLLFYPLSAASYKSMAKMRVVAPKMQRIKDQYGNDRQRMQQAMMELYKTEQINPLGGCLPILIQIPVFIALYWVLLASVELRHAPFLLWIDDLTRAAIGPNTDMDLASVPYFVLPLLMAATMIIQTRLNPEPPDPVQAKVMKIMPLMFGVFFFWFPSGLVLYWLVNNILSIAQQWHITRTLERAAAAQTRKR